MRLTTHVARKISRRTLLAGGLAGAATLAGADVLWEPGHPELVEKEVLIPGLGAAFDGYRIGLLADIHWPRNIHRDFVRDAAETLVGAKPDLIVIPGDICDLKRHPAKLVIGDAFDGFRAPDGVLGTLGNHDHGDGRVNEIRRAIAKTPIELIDGDHRVIERAGERLVIGGVGDYRWNPMRPEVAFFGAPDGPRILLAHNPDQPVDERWEVPVALTLCGHTHGGEIRMPFYGALAMPIKHKWMDAGMKRTPNGPVYVNRGLGSPRRARFRCRPELTVLTLRSSV